MHVAYAETAVCLQLDDMQREMKDTVAAQEEAARRAQEETARRTEAMVEEERSRTSLMMRQARGEVEQEAAAASEEASLVLSRAEQLRQAAADTEAAATRRVRACTSPVSCFSHSHNLVILQCFTATIASVVLVGDSVSRGQGFPQTIIC